MVEQVVQDLHWSQDHATPKHVPLTAIGELLGRSVDVQRHVVVVCK